jgi:carbamoyl-phosphate synthase large subunit
VLVTGAGGPSGAAAITALKARRFTVTAVDMGSVAHQADHFALVPAARDPAYVATHQALLSSGGVTWFFPTVADELVLAAQMAPRLRSRGITVFISNAGAVRTCSDKWQTARALRAHGIAVPRSAIGPAADAAVRALGFPVVSRPRVGRGGRGVVVHEAAGTPPSTDAAIWQEFMPGTEYDVLFVRHPDAPHRMLTLQVFEKTVLKEGRVGNALEVVPVAAPDVAALAEAAATVLGLTGPIDMDVRRGADGVPRLLEINARIGAHALRAPRVFDVLVELFEQGHRG